MLLFAYSGGSLPVGHTTNSGWPQLQLSQFRIVVYKVGKSIDFKKEGLCFQFGLKVEKFRLQKSRSLKKD